MRSLLGALALLSVLVPSAVSAETRPAPPLPAAAAVCANCHGTDGRRQGAIPAIAGRPAALLLESLRQFRADKAADATVMPRLIKGLTEEELSVVATYFAAIR